MNDEVEPTIFKRESKAEKARKVAASFGALSLLGAAYFAVQGKREFDNPFAVIEAGFGRSCPDVDVYEQTAVLQLLDQQDVPKSKVDTLLLGSAGTNLVEQHAASAESAASLLAFIASEHRSYQSAAAQNGFELVPPEQYIGRILDATNNQQAIAAFAEYVAKFEIVLQVPTDASKYISSVTAEPLAVETMYSQSFKAALIDMANVLSCVPKQLVALSGVEKLRLYKSLRRTEQGPMGENSLTLASTTYFAHSINIAMQPVVDGTLEVREHFGLAGKSFVHELGHHIDYALCGGVLAAPKDDSVAALTTVAPYGSNELMESAEVAEPYGGTAIEEDKATIFERVLSLDLSKTSAVVDQKATVLIARINNELPNYANFVAATATQ